MGIDFYKKYDIIRVAKSPGVLLHWLGRRLWAIEYGEHIPRMRGITPQY